MPSAAGWGWLQVDRRIESGDLQRYWFELSGSATNAPRWHQVTDNDPLNGQIRYALDATFPAGLENGLETWDPLLEMLFPKPNLPRLTVSAVPRIWSF
ncbi:hypothetical protein [Thiomonas sp.]